MRSMDRVERFWRWSEIAGRLFIKRDSPRGQINRNNNNYNNNLFVIIRYMRTRKMCVCSDTHVKRMKCNKYSFSFWSSICQLVVCALRASLPKLKSYNRRYIFIPISFSIILGFLFFRFYLPRNFQYITYQCSIPYTIYDIYITLI